MNNHNILVICGPTASGKTGIALRLAKELKTANILSVDSRQVYKDLDIVTGKDTPQDLSSQIKIFGHSIYNPDETANLADFVRYSYKVIADSKKQKIPLIIVGGTGLYLKAITQKLSDILIPPDQVLRSQIEKLTLGELQILLDKENHQKLVSLNRSDFMNPRRLIRAIEISRSKANPLVSDISSEKVSFHYIGIHQNIKNLKSNIRKRVEERLSAGAVKEVKKLIKNFPDRKLSIYSSLGVPQIINFLEGKNDENELIETWVTAEVNYAKRQMVWFRKQSEIVWYDKGIDGEQFFTQLKKIINKND